MSSSQTGVQAKIERVLVARGWGAKRVAKEQGIGRNTVRRYQRGSSSAERHETNALGARCLGDGRLTQMFIVVAEAMPSSCDMSSFEPASM